jgi:polysaccharide export outer membrane protein
MFSGRGWLAAFQVLFAGFLFTGCQTSDPVIFSPVPGELGGESSSPGAPQVYSDRFRIGELVVIKFSGPSVPPPTHEERIKEDGTLTLPDIGAVTATNKTPGELQKELTELYRKYYISMVVTVIPQDRVYHVGGQVRSPGAKMYLGETTVITAIQGAGDFTEFAKTTAVELTRAGSSKPIKVNCKKALQDRSLDLPVFPGDKIHVPRRLF